MLYRFETTATMKDYNSAKWWIDSGIVRPVEVEADDLKTAFQEWRQTVIDRDYIEISNNAIRNKSPMYKDTADGPKQTGFVITGKTEFDKGDYSGWSTQYIDLWVSVRRIETIDEWEAA
jgi:hypothetical protein